ncbi:hypothetical protein CBL_08070 [Carabus blaptoides fortunei]
MACLAIRASLLFVVFVLNNLREADAYPPSFEEFTGDGTQDAQLCFPSEYFKVDCNVCRCSADGKTYACTRKACPREQNLQELPDYSDEYNIPPSSIRKRSINQKQELTKRRRDLGDYDDPNQQFYNYDEPISQQERQELERQSRLMQRQMAEDRRQEAIQLAAQQQELNQQVSEVQEQLNYQKAIDDLQRQYDEAQQDLDAQQYDMDRQQALYDKQQEEEIEKQMAMEFRKKGYY